MAHRLGELGLIPDLIFSSPASRAHGTALIMSGVWGIKPASLQVHDELYMAYVSEIEQVVSCAPDQVMNLAIFGHNPSFTEYANKFLEDRLDNLPTAGVVVVTLESDRWKGIGYSHVKQTYVDYPKRLPQ